MNYYLNQYQEIQQTLTQINDLPNDKLKNWRY